MNFYLLLILAIAIKDEWMMRLFNRRSFIHAKQNVHV